MKVLILGGTGLLGKALVREWRGDDVLALGSRDVDIPQMQTFPAAGPSNSTIENFVRG